MNYCSLLECAYEYIIINLSEKRIKMVGFISVNEWDILVVPYRKVYKPKLGLYMWTLTLKLI